MDVEGEEPANVAQASNDQDRRLLVGHGHYMLLYSAGAEAFVDLMKRSFVDLGLRESGGGGADSGRG